MKKVLIVEDDNALFKMYSTELKMNGYDVVGVSDGLLALDAIRQEKPDVILLDIVLPGMNGLQILQEIKNDEETARVKVLMLTNYGDDDNVAKALEAGAEDYLLKYNIVPSELSEKIAQVLGEAAGSAVTLTSE